LRSSFIVSEFHLNLADNVTVHSGLYFFIGIPASLQSEFSLTPAATKTPGHVKNTTSFLFQPEVLLLYDLLSSDLDKTRKSWMKIYPEFELERIANACGISLD
jgi:hypothetical protein